MAYRIWLLAFAVSVISTLVSIRYVDRPLAEHLELHFRHTELWNLLDRLLAPFKLVALAALLSPFAAGWWVMSGRRLGPSLNTLLICASSVVWGLAAEFVFKQIFGRSWPDPTYVKNHLYGFRLLHASEHWSSFPSGTAIGSAALVAAIWLVAPRWRIPCLLLAVLICVGMVVCNYHWLSDVIAGAFLGASIGWMTVLLYRRPV